MKHFAPSRRSYRGELYAKYSARSDIPLTILSIAMVVALLLPDVVNLTQDELGVLDTLDWIIYSFFVADLAIKLYLAPSIFRHIKSNWLDVVIVALPLLRPLRIVRSARILRLLRLVRLAAFAFEGIGHVLRSFRKRKFHLVAGLVLFWVLASAGLVMIFERNSGGSIHSFIDALWWALATVTTVGYGDMTPVSPEGRVIAIALMLVGISFYGILTANIAAHFVQLDDDKDDKALHAKLDLVLARLDSVETQLGQLRTPAQETMPATQRSPNQAELAPGTVYAEALK